MTCWAIMPERVGAAGADSTITVIGLQTEQFDAERAELGLSVTVWGKKRDKLLHELEMQVQMVMRIIDSIGGETVQAARGRTENAIRDVKDRRGRNLAVQHIGIKVSDMKRLTDVYQVLSTMKSVTFERIAYYVDDEPPKADQLLRLATEDARRQATAAASELGVTLGEPVEVFVNPSAQEVYQASYARQNGQLLRDCMVWRPQPRPGEGTPTVQLSAAVRIKFAIR